MDIRFILIFCTISVWFLTSCHLTQQFPDQAHVVSIQREPCDSNQSISHMGVYLAGEEMNFEYKKLAIIQASNGNNPKVNPVYTLKKIAAKQCADAVIQINLNSYEGNFVKADVLQSCLLQSPVMTSVNYPISSYTGIAVRLIRRDSTTYLRSDTQFVKRYNKDLAAAKPTTSDCQSCGLKRNSRALAIVGGGFLGIFFGLVLLSR